MDLARQHVHVIVSGGQTGVDRAALDVAMFCGIEHGGWCPRGRLAEDGSIPSRYRLKENQSKDYAKRTKQNVVDSDATLILYVATLKGGTALTRKLARELGRPCLLVDLGSDTEWESSQHEVAQWIAEQNIGVLNVAGPRESSNPGIGKLAERFLLPLFVGRDDA